MSILKNTFNRVFNKSHTISPSNNSNNCCIEFCWREIHDPLYECCFAAEINCITNNDAQNSFNKRKNFKTKRRKSCKRKSSRPISRLYKVAPISNLINCSNKSNSISSLNASTVTPAIDDNVKSNLVHKSITNLPPQRNGTSHNNNNNNILESLCDKFESFAINDLIPHQRCQRFNKLYAKIPEHDKRILNRMAKKRTDEIARIEDATIAHKYWDNERFSRDIIISKHNEQFTNAINAKREQDTYETRERLKMLADRDRSYLEKIKDDIMRKNEKLQQRLRNVELSKEIRKCERQQEELQKFESAIVTQQQVELTDHLRKQECFSHLESRISRADAMRKYFLQAYKRRLCTDNELEQNVHAVHYEEIKRNEKYKMELLKREIGERDKRSKEFQNRKQKIMNELRDQARATSELRDIIRRSISPDNYSFRAMLVRGGGSVTERPMSNLSYQSHVKLG